MDLSYVVTMLQATLLILSTVSGHPELPQTSRDSAIHIAKQAISEATAALSHSGSLAAAQAKPIDVFLIAGGSNAVGFGSSDKSPRVSAESVLQFSNANVFAANDPVGNASTGSTWPQFGVTYTNKTGRKIAFVPAASANSSLIARFGGAWNPTSGTSFTDSLLNLQNALQALKTSGYSPELKGILWSQGEIDALAINSNTMSASEYAAALQSVVEGFRKSLNQAVPFYIAQIGNQVGADNRGFGEIRRAQNLLAESTPGVHIVVRDAGTFPLLGMMNGSTNTYTQAGYNDIGSVAGGNVANALSGKPLSTSKPSGLLSIVPQGRAVTFIGYVNSTNSCEAASYSLSYGDGSADDISQPINVCGPYMFATTHTYSAPGTYDLKLAAGSVASNQSDSSDQPIQSTTYTVE